MWEIRQRSRFPVVRGTRALVSGLYLRQFRVSNAAAGKHASVGVRGLIVRNASESGSDYIR